MPPYINFGGKKLPDNEAVKITVTVLPSYEPLIISFVLLHFAKLVRPTDTNLEGVWS